MGLNMNQDQEVFAKMVEDLLSEQKLAKGSVSRKEYERFCHEYIFDVLRDNDPFGVAFCKRFDLGDYMLTRVFKNDVEKCKELIEESGYLDDTRSN